MGRATRWLKDLFGIKSRDNKERNDYSGDRKQKSRCHSGRDAAAGLCNNPTTIPPNITPAEAAWLRSFYGESSDKDQNKHAIAVAAATAAAADAAVAAAQAAVAVVRLTSQGRGPAAVFGGSREKWAAVKIQTVFRGYLARKALRALRGLVKIQALVRGFLVRKQAAATLYSMQALIRAQASVRALKMRTRLINNSNKEDSLEKYEVGRSEEQQYPTLTTSSLQHSRRLSGSLDNVAIINNSFEENNAKIVEVDTGKSRSRRANSGDESFGKLTVSSSPSVKCRWPELDSRNIPDQEYWGECHFSTAQSTPRFNSCGCSSNGGGGGGNVTPAKSVCTESPNYMAKTKSFKAKVRSQSAPKQRAGEVGPTKRRLNLQEILLESRNSLSGVTMQRSCSHARQTTVNFKNAIMGKLARSSDFVTENNFYPNYDHLL